VVIGCGGRSGGAAGLRVERASVCAGFSGVRVGLDSRVGDGSRLVVGEGSGLGLVGYGLGLREQGQSVSLV
jgi:hypothetical protein